MSQQPISLNLALIVHRLLTSARGWRVSHLQEELGIAPRTYRKYRRLLQEEFHPLLRRDGTSAVVEVRDGDERYLRLRPPRVIGTADPELERLTAAIYFARSLLESTHAPGLLKAAAVMVSDFHASLKDRDFLINGLLAEADRMFTVRTETIDCADGIVDRLVRAITNRRMVALTFEPDGREDVIAAPLTLCISASCLTCIVQVDDGTEEVDVSRLGHVEILDDTFQYPSRHQYMP